MFLKKFLVLFTLVIFIIMTACSSAETPTQTDSPAATPEPTVKEPFVELTAWSDKEPPQGLLTSKSSETKVGLAIANASGASFTVNYTQGDKETNFNLRLASKDWEDIIVSSNISFDWTQKLIDTDAIIQLDKYFEDPTNYPNLAKIPKEVLDNFRYSDGHIYQFPSQWYEDPNSVYGYWAASGWYINPDILKSVNMTADDLSSIKGIESFLKAVKAAKLKDANGSPIIPLSGSQDINLWKTIASTYGVTTAGNGFELQSDGKFLNYRDDPRLVTALKWLNDMNRAGVVDLELVSQKNEQLQQKLTNKRVGLVPDQAWGFWGLVTAGQGPVTELLKVPFPKVDGVSSLGVQGTYNPNGTSGIFVTKNSKNPDAIAKYADWSSEKGVQRGWEMVYGPRGLFWDWDPEHGEPNYKLTDPEFIEAQTKGDYKKMNELGFSSIVNLSPFDLDLNYFNKAAEPQLFWIFDMHKFYAKQNYIVKFKDYYNVKVPPDGKWLKNIGTLNKVDTEYFTKLILAKNDADFNNIWKGYQTQIEQQGEWAAVKAEWNAAYQATKK